MSPSQKDLYHFGPFSLSLAERILMRDGRLVEVMQKWRFTAFNLWVVHVGNRYLTRPVRVFKEFAAQMAPTLFPTLPT